MAIFTRNEVEEAITKVYEGDSRIEDYQHIVDKKVEIFMNNVCGESKSPNNKWLKSDISQDSIVKAATTILDNAKRYKLYSILKIFGISNEYDIINESPCDLLERWANEEAPLSAMCEDLNVKNSEEAFKKFSLMIEGYYTDKQDADIEFSRQNTYKHNQNTDQYDRIPFVIDNSTDCREYQCPRCRTISKISLNRDAFSSDSEWKVRPVMVRCTNCHKNLILDNKYEEMICF